MPMASANAISVLPGPFSISTTKASNSVAMPRLLPVLSRQAWALVGWRQGRSDFKLRQCRELPRLWLGKGASCTGNPERSLELAACRDDAAPQKARYAHISLLLPRWRRPHCHGGDGHLRGRRNGQTARTCVAWASPPPRRPWPFCRRNVAGPSLRLSNASPSIALIRNRQTTRLVDDPR